MCILGRMSLPHAHEEPHAGTITMLLREARAGNSRAEAELLATIYKDLREIAHQYVQRRGCNRRSMGRRL